MVVGELRRPPRAETPEVTMSTATRAVPVDASAVTPKGLRRTGIVLSALPVLFLLWDGIMKVLLLPIVVEGTTQLGYPAESAFGIGVVLLASVAVYVYPRTALLGAILLTGYLGGAVATHVRVENPLFSHILFPVYVAILLWAGLVLRDKRLRGILLGTT